MILLKQTELFKNNYNIFHLKLHLKISIIEFNDTEFMIRCTITCTFVCLFVVVIQYLGTTTHAHSNLNTWCRKDMNVNFFVQQIEIKLFPLQIKEYH